MTTEIITLSEYRKNLSSLWKKGAQKNIKYLVMVHGKPAFEVSPVNSNELDPDWIEHNEEHHQARLQAVKELENGEAKTIDFTKIKTEEDFIAFLQE